MATKIKTMDEIYEARMKRQGKTPEDDPLQSPAPTQQAEPNDADYDDEPSDPAPSEPAKTVSVPEDKYNELTNELNKLRNDMKSMEGRLGPTQRQNASMEKIIASMEEKHRNEVSVLEERLKAFEAEREAMSQKSAFEEAMADLSDEERELFDEQQLNALGKLMSRVAAKNNPRGSVEAQVKAILDKREEDRINNYRNDVLENPNKDTSIILQTASDPKFQEWAQENYDVRIAVNNLLTAKTIRDIDESAKHLVKRIKNFRDETQKGTKTEVKTDATTVSLQNAMNRRSVSERGKPNEAETAAKLKQLRELSRSRSPADRAKAQALYSELNFS